VGKLDQPSLAPREPGGIRQENSDVADQWLFDALDDGHLADAAWCGFFEGANTEDVKDTDGIGNGKLSAR
jgi:hypothetical protein